MAKIVMNDFVEDYRVGLSKLGLKNQVRLMKLYVDNLNQAGHTLQQLNFSFDTLATLNFLLPTFLCHPYTPQNRFI